MALPLTNGQPVDCGLLTARNRDLSDCLKAAMTRRGVQVKEIAITWECSHVYVSRILSGQDPLPDYRVSQLDLDLQIALAEEWCADLGLLTGHRAAAIGALQAGLHLLALEDVPLKMARASVEPATAAEPKRRRA